MFGFYDKIPLQANPAALFQSHNLFPEPQEG
jgi:hypothetical protein